jgi:hypothetical protein
MDGELYVPSSCDPVDTRKRIGTEIDHLTDAEVIKLEKSIRMLGMLLYRMARMDGEDIANGGVIRA